MQIRLPKNWRNPTKLSIFCVVFFIASCSTSTTNVRPSFDENPRNRKDSAVRPSRVQERVQEQEEVTQQTTDTTGEFTVEPRQKIEEKPSSRVSSRGGEFKRAAEKYLGTPYHFGGTTRRGFDCSGFVWRVYQDLGHSNFPRESSQLMYDRGRPVSRNSLREGDLVFFRDPKNRKKINHVGIYISDDRFIHSSSTRGVAYSTFSDDYWKKYLVGFKRLLP